MMVSVPDVYFSAEQRAAVDVVVHRDLGGPDAVGLAYLGGSLAVGLGHAASDVDLYAVGDLPFQDRVYESGGVTVHVSALRADSVRGLVELTADYRATGLVRDQIYLDQKSLLALVRLTTGLPVLITPEWTAILDTLRRDTVRKIFMARNTNMFVAYAEDVAGSLASGDLLTATSTSALALETAGEVALASADDLYFGPKFLVRRLSRTPATAAWAPVVWRLLNHAFSTPHPDEAEVRRVAERRLYAANLLVSACALHGWDRPLADLPAPTDATPPRSPYFAPVRFADGWALMGPEHAYEVTEALVRRWFDLTERDTGPEVAALAAVGALGTNPPLPGTPHPPDAELPEGLRLRWAPRFTIHPRAEPAATGGTA
ncbi:hypothetical protein ACTG9Q_12060 [Actinokineospora sp. 24-640]